MIAYVYIVLCSIIAHILTDFDDIAVNIIVDFKIISRDERSQHPILHDLQHLIQNQWPPLRADVIKTCTTASHLFDPFPPIEKRKIKHAPQQDAGVTPGEHEVLRREDIESLINSLQIQRTLPNPPAKSIEPLLQPSPLPKAINPPEQPPFPALLEHPNSQIDPTPLATQAIRQSVNECDLRDRVRGLRGELQALQLLPASASV
jgi:hypothetical protein